MVSEDVDRTVPPDVSALVATAGPLTEAVQSLREDLKAEAVKRAAAVAGEGNARRRSFRRTWMTIALDVGLSLAGLWLWHVQAATNARLQESLQQNYTTAQQQVQTRVRVLCPLYEVLLAVAEDPSRTVGMSADQKARSDAAVKVIQDGITTLGCTVPNP